MSPGQICNECNVALVQSDNRSLDIFLPWRRTAPDMSSRFDTGPCFVPQCALCAMNAMCCGGDGSWFAKSVQMNMFLYDACRR